MIPTIAHSSLIRTLYTLTCDTSGLNETQLHLEESIQQFANSELAPKAEEFDKNGVFPADWWKKLGDMGLLGITAPAQYGGLELGYTEHCIAMEQLSRASPSIALSYGAHSQLAVNQLTKWATEEQKEKWLPGLISGDMVGALAMSEPDSGSDVVSMKTRAIADGDNYILNGSKMWITNGGDADVIIVYAKTNPEAGAKGITAFLVEKGMKGFLVEKKLDKLGMRASNTYGLAFDNVVIPKSNILGDLNKGVKVLMSGLDSERLVLSAGPLGIMRACLDAVIPYSRERKQFNTPIGQFQLMQGTIADMYGKYQSSRAFLYTLARQFDTHYKNDSLPIRKDCASCILQLSENATWAAGEAVKALGGNGYTTEYPVERLYRDAMLYNIGAGTNNIRRMLIGREIFHES